MMAHPRNWWLLFLRRPFARLRMLRGLRATVLSEFMRENLVRNGFPKANVRVVPPTVSRSMRPRRPVAAGEPLKILFLGQLVAGKGCDLLLRSVGLLKRPYRLTVAGDGRDRRRLESLARGVTNGVVRFVGWVCDGEALLDDADVLAFPSRWQEPYGLAGAEAVAHGVPVVAYDVGGVRSWADGSCRLVPPGDVAAFARALEEVA